MKTRAFNRRNFTLWLNKQPADRVFDIDNPELCVGTAFCREFLEISSAKVFILSWGRMTGPEGHWIKKSTPRFFVKLINDLGDSKTAGELRKVLKILK